MLTVQLIMIAALVIPTSLRCVQVWRERETRQIAFFCCGWSVTVIGVGYFFAAWLFSVLATLGTGSLSH